MLKYVLFGAAMTMTVPALAQTAQNPTPGVQAAPTSPDIQTTPAPADPATAAAPAEAGQPVKPTDIASVIDSEFATYDKDGDGKLNQVEFGTWMVALKSQTDPKTDANSPATKKWNQAAFAQADTDKSKSVSKTELTGFLAPAAKS